MIKSSSTFSNTTQASNTSQGTDFSIAPYTILGNTELQYVSCATNLMSYTNSSNAWYEGQISKGSYTMTTTTTAYNDTSLITVYPTNVSTYKLCDGSPRVDAKPVSITSLSTYSFVQSGTQALPATFPPAPCTLGAAGCAWLNTNTTMGNSTVDDYYLVDLCGLEPNEGTACVIQGGPIRLLYVDVEISLARL